MPYDVQSEDRAGNARAPDAGGGGMVGRAAGVLLPRTAAVRSGGGYGSPAFVAASGSVRGLRERSEAMALGLLGAGIVLREAPRLALALADTPGGREIDRQLRTGAYRLPAGRRLRVAQGVLTLPASREEYLGGGGRRPLRKKLARAQRLALHVEPVGERGRRPLATELLPYLAGTNAWALDVLGADDLCLVARDRDGRILGAALVTVDGPVALLRALVSIPGAEGQSEARYALHTEVVAALIGLRAQVMCTVSPSALRLPAGLQQFQHQTGYELAHLLWRAPGTGTDTVVESAVPVRWGLAS